MRCIIVLAACVALSQAALTGHHSGNKVELTPEEKARIMDDLIEADLEKEIEKMIDTLDADELDQLEAILSKPLDEESELQMIHAELEELGMDPQDVQDMFDLAEMMTKFLMKIPDVEDKLNINEDEYSIEDHCKLYLLGLPNKLGPMGFLALHSILESAGEAVVDVEIGSFEPASEAGEEAKGDSDESSVASLGDLFQRKRREIEAKEAAAAEAAEAAEAAKARKAMPAAAAEAVKVMPAAGEAGQARKAMPGAAEPEDIVSEILKRRRRAIDDKAKIYGL